MLETFREHANSVFSKILYGMIALAFIAYFGVSFARRYSPGGPSAPIAKVNGEGIPSGEWEMEIKGQEEKLEALNPGQKIPDLGTILQSQVLQRLVGNMLFSQEAHHLGLRVSDQEVADEIRNYPGFQVDGQFNEEYYLKTARPRYEQYYGLDYEDNLRQKILGDKLKGVIENSAVISDQQVDDNVAMDSNELNIKQFSVAISDPKNKDALQAARESVKKWIASEKAGTQPESQPSSVEQDTGMQPLTELQYTLGQEDSLPIFSCLFQLKPGEVCDNVFQIKNSMVGVKLIDRKTLAVDPSKHQTIKNQLGQGRKNALLTAVLDLLTHDAKIESYIQSKK